VAGSGYLWMISSTKSDLCRAVQILIFSSIILPIDAPFGKATPEREISWSLQES
jgi:hypothetical protein